MRRSILLFVLVISLGGCAPQFQLGTPAGTSSVATGIPAASAEHAGGVPGLRVTTDDDGLLFFHRGSWQLTMRGIRGTADVYPAEGGFHTTDTTLSYWSTSSASPAGRSSTMGQFMLTLLGVILVLGLAAIILYAAFLATDR